MRGEQPIDTAQTNLATSANQLVAHRLQLGPNQSLAYWTLGERTFSDGQARPTLILLHGMRDVGRSLLPVASAVSDQFFCVLPDLRGHGQSFQPGAYAIQHFLMDLRRLQDELQLERVSLLGHSLGGHVVCRYAGLFADSVEGVIVVEGLGPPRFGTAREDGLERVANQLQSAITTATHANNPRNLPNVAEAAKRLCKSNPRLDAEWALQLAQWGTYPVPDTDQGQPDAPVRWAFDPRAQEVFLGVSDKINFDYWRAIRAPTLVVMGSLGHEYWGSRFPTNGYTGHFAPGELEERLTAIGTTRHIEIADAGHQVHYDQPELLAAASRAFLLQDVLNQNELPAAPQGKHSK